MDSDSRAATVRSLNRINLRLAGDTIAEIDAACAPRPGNVTRNTWIAEAVEETLASERQVPVPQARELRAHG
jgi:hypothetical protein